MATVTDQPCTHPSLLIRLRNPHAAAACTEFVDLYGPVLFAWCRRRGLQDNDAAEVMQEVLLQVSRSIAGFSYDPDRGRFRGWLTAILKSKLVAFRKILLRHSNGQSPSMDDIAGCTDGDWIELCQQRVMDLALAELRSRSSAEHWNAFESVWLKHEAPDVVALRMARNVAWVYLVKSRALTMLREIVVRISADVPWRRSDDGE